jgi:precorrin-2 dehydrogenase/sirohydrochlorin ferrochelatase
MRYYPVFLDIAGKPVVVIGGGLIARQKVEGLIKAGAAITVISPELSDAMSLLASEGRFRHEKRDYQPGDLEGYTIAFVATDDRAINATVAAEGKARRVLVNAVDDTPNCDFVMPAIVTRGELILAVSTSGTSPAMARKMREELEEFLTEDYVLMLELAAEVRAELREQDVLVTTDIWNAALDNELRTLLREGRREEAKERLTRSLLEPVSG